MRTQFPEHFTPKRQDVKGLWGEAVFVFDTNVLLNCYRVSRDTSNYLLTVLKSLKGRLFLPHQVGVEFFRRREGVIAEQVNAFAGLKQHINGLAKKLRDEFQRHPTLPISEIADSLGDWGTSQCAKIDAVQQEHPLNYFTIDDPILPELELLFTGCDEAAWEEKADKELEEKIAERYSANEAPCHHRSNDGKTPPAANPHVGDGRVWFQIVKHAGEKKTPLVFVTEDAKANWWRHAKVGNDTRPVGPHFLLMKDIQTACGKQFLMYTQGQFLDLAPEHLGVPRQEKAVKELREVQQAGTRLESVAEQWNAIKELREIQKTEVCLPALTETVSEDEWDRAAALQTQIIAQRRRALHLVGQELATPLAPLRRGYHERRWIAVGEDLAGSVEKGTTLLRAAPVKQDSSRLRERYYLLAEAVEQANHYLTLHKHSGDLVPLPPPAPSPGPEPF